MEKEEIKLFQVNTVDIPCESRQLQPSIYLTQKIVSNQNENDEERCK